MALETTYAYDFPDLFKRNMIDIWNEHRARFPNSVHPPDSEICTNQVNKLKLMSFVPLNFEIGSESISFFVFCWIQKNDRPIALQYFEITQPFLYLEGAPKYILQQHWKYKIFQYLTPISTIIGSDDMIRSTHDPCIKTHFYSRRRYSLGCSVCFETKGINIPCQQVLSSW